MSAVTEQPIKEFQDAGMLWFVNRILHVFGWVLVVQSDDQGNARMYPAHTRFRGFPLEAEDAGYTAVTKDMAARMPELLAAVE